MATCDTGDGDLSLAGDTKRLSFVDSLFNFDMACKSPTEMDSELKKRQEKIEHCISEAQKTSICFMLDCTGSMSPWINEMKNNIKYWSDQLHDKHEMLELNLAFVRYTDYDQPESTRTTVLDFTIDIDEFRQFVDGIKAPNGVGGDQAEDVFGGLDAVLNLSWPAYGTKVMIHISDAPCHGLAYHNQDVGDKFPKGDPGGRQLGDLMKNLAEHNIIYYFGYIKKSCTHQMIKAFSSSLQAQSEGLHSIQEFDAHDPAKLLSGAYKSVADSISVTLDVLMSDAKRSRSKRTYTIIDTSTPNWDELESRTVLITKPPATGSSAQLEVPSEIMSVKIAPNPFAEGNQKVVYDAFDDDNQQRIVLKQSKYTDARSNSLKRCIETSQTHAVAARFSAEFNRERPDEASEIQFTRVGVMAVQHGERKNFFTYERNLKRRDSYKKFNSNFYHMEQDDDDVYTMTCQAFSHYTYNKSGNFLVICDLQGVVSGSRLQLTDPAIHCLNVLWHGSTNLGEKGIKQFFRIHKCNDVCKDMKLKHPNFE